MSISQDELQKIAEKLSKIPGDNSTLLWNISDTLGYMERLSELDTSWVTPTVSVVQHHAPLREDILRDKDIATQDLIACSWQKVVANQIVLPNIMK